MMKTKIALIIPDFSHFANRVPIILGTPTIGQVVNMMKEAEMDALAMHCGQMQRAAHLLAIQRMAPVEVEDDRKEGYNTSQESFIMHTRNVETLEPFSSHVIPIKMTRSLLGRMP